MFVLRNSLKFIMLNAMNRCGTKEISLYNMDHLLACGICRRMLFIPKLSKHHLELDRAEPILVLRAYQPCSILAINYMSGSLEKKL